MVLSQMRDQPRSICRLRLKRVDSSARPDQHGGQQGEIAEIRPRIDKMVSRPKQPLDQPRGVQLVEPIGHAAIGIGRQIELKSQSIGGGKRVAPLRAGSRPADEPGQPIAAALGRRNAAITAQRCFGEGAHHESNSNDSRAMTNGRFWPMFSSNPAAIKLATRLLPPELTKGSVSPVTGMSLRQTIRFKNVCPANIATTPTATSRPKGSRVFDAISMPAVNKIA